MANYIVSDTDLTSIADAIRTKGGTSAQLSFPNGFNTAIANIPTGLPIVTGEFTAQTTAGVQTITIPYTGNGYPIALGIIVKGGIENAEPFNSQRRSAAIGAMTIFKGTPSSKTSRYGVRGYIQKSGSSWSVNNVNNFQPFNSSDSPTASTLAFITNASVLSIYVSNTSTTNGFYSGQDYEYWVMYYE